MNTNEVFNVLIIGGYGNAGRPLARLLLKHAPSKVHLTLAGRHLDRANEFVEELKQEFPSCKERVTGQEVDAANGQSLRDAFREVDMVIMASSTSAFATQVATAALEAGIDYFDIILSSEKVEALKSLASKIKSAGLCFVTDGGFHPGLPAAMVRYIAPSFKRLESANVSSYINFDCTGLKAPSPETMEEFASEIQNTASLVYKGGAWQDAGIMATMLNPKSVDFGEAFGHEYCVPMFLEEMKAIPDMYPDIAETGFYVGGFNWVVNYLVLPIAAVALWAFPQKAKRPMGRFLCWGLRTFSKPPFGTILKVEAKGIGLDGAPLEKDITVSHEDAYILTAIPVVATLLQYLSEKESIRKPGLWFEANVVDPDRMMEDMDYMGLKITPPLR